MKTEFALSEDFKRRLLRRLQNMIRENNIASNFRRIVNNLELIREGVVVLSKIAGVLAGSGEHEQLWYALCDYCVWAVGYCPGHCDAVIALSARVDDPTFERER